ncbi:hypothetical protein JW964_28615 [candidate division KSB1 bacterium]|nr:hypothetical protein [candidate division KSB1 bacterium]
MDIKEHIYHDDPNFGPADVRTALKDVDYFFLGNGFVEVAIQISPSGEGTAAGVLMMDPEKFGPKRKSLTMDLERGLKDTSLSIQIDDKPALTAPLNVQAAWTTIEGIPAVQLKWKAFAIEVVELFYSPDRETPRLIREILLVNSDSMPHEVKCQTGIKGQFIDRKMKVAAGQEIRLAIEYQIDTENDVVKFEFLSSPIVKISAKAKQYWEQTAKIDFGSPVINQLYRVSQNLSSANIAHSGRMDASIWQYNLEWVRDQSNVVMGLILSGQFELAKTLLERMLTQFVTDAGDTVDSSQVRPPEETELDQNGVLLLALKTYIDWTGDFEIIKKHWARIQAIAEFPLKPVFRHEPSGLLHNQREYWERHAIFGIEDGMEMIYQFYVSVGLKCAAEFARSLNKPELAEKWESIADSIKSAMLNDPKFSLVENGHFIKRRRVDGTVQREIHPRPELESPPGTPLADDKPHLLNPDACFALPIALRFIDPNGELAQNTLQDLEKLWNMTWNYGGYSRYHVSSDPDSPGPWPLACMMIAQAYLEGGNDEKVWRVLNWLNTISGTKSGGWFEFYGHRQSPPAAQNGIIPWTWAEVIKFFIHHLLSIRPNGDKLVLMPRLLDGLSQISASIRVRNIRLDLTIQKAQSDAEKGYLIESKKFPYSETGIELPFPDRDLSIKMWI